MQVDLDYSASAYLALRHIPRQEPPPTTQPLRVHDAGEVLGALAARCAAQPADVGVLLSGGIDSAILAALLPPSTKTLTIVFDAPGAVDESQTASVYAARCGLDHHIVPVGWRDYLACMDLLMQRKQAPLHAVEPALYQAACRARELGVQNLVVGNGADSTFGGMDRLLAEDWSFEAFVRRYTFLDPSRVLRRPVCVDAVFEPYRRGDGIDVQGFLKVVHGQGIVEAFENAIAAAGLGVSAPFEDLTLAEPLDLARIRRGEPKYLLQQVFRELYPGLPVAPKKPFPRPMSAFLAGWPGPRHPLFAPFQVGELSGEQRWLVYCLERWLRLLP